jgi:hypothetical protein
VNINLRPGLITEIH